MRSLVSSLFSLFFLSLALHPLAALAHDEHSASVDREAPRSEEPSMRGAYGGPFMLQDQTGKTVTDEDFHGKFVMLTFGYGSCGDVCPTMLQSMARTMDLLGPQAEKVQPIFISLDPARDTPARLKDFMAAFHPKLLGLTGPEAYVASAARKYRIRYEKIPGKNGDYSIDHTAVVFLMGPDGNFLERFPHSATPEDMAKRIAKRIADAPPPAPADDKTK